MGFRVDCALTATQVEHDARIWEPQAGGIKGLGFRVQGLGFRVYKVQGLGFRVYKVQG